jgi:hypothetical protein
MVPVEIVAPADGKAHAVDRQGIPGAERFQPAMRRTACAHEILGVNLEEAERMPASERCGVMRGLEPDADSAR